ncbi:NF-X1-type zinc finger protein NFXL2-like [Camellia sinensis]|uniref:NF-X1-type zinc finger protein NFXL2-like n=1 Tax=Camellia sinensis TaxID=4442 RepID=UPI001035D53A|nr:NF-X1-type zinc finger protein NFXL2-like [Camellia sinensis]
MMVCSNIAEYSCNNLCGNLLPCGNHYCTKVCHALKSQSSSLGRHGRGEFCEECDLPCQKERQPACPHPCPQPCHRGECPPCKVLIRRSCHCGSMVQVFECLYYNSMSENEQMTVRSCGRPCHGRSFIIVFGLETQPACPHPCPQPCHPGECPPCKVLIRRSCHCRSMVHVFECMSEKEQMTVRSCGGPCHRKLPYCTHLCPEICHPGQCPAPEKCSEKKILWSG